MSEWKLMETADFSTPRHVLLWFRGVGTVVALFHTPDHYECVGYMGRDKPTHWMPEPSPPEGE